MIQSVSNQANVEFSMTQPKANAASTKPHQPTEDSVALSAAAKAIASGDVDHDGDSR